MRKIIIAGALIIGVLSATQTRVTTFGGVADFLKDDYLALTYPSQMLNFPSTLVLEAFDEATLIGGQSYLKGYFGLGENHSMGVWGAYLNIPVYQNVRGAMFSYSKFFGENLAFGINFGFGLYNNTVEDTAAGTKTESSVSTFSLNPGITFFLSETDFVDAAINFTAHSFENKTNGTTTSKAKGTADMAFDARYWKSMSEYTSMILGLHFLSQDNSTEVGGVESTNKHTLFGVNFGFNTKPTDMLNLILGVTLSSHSWDYGDAGKQSQFTLAGVFGFEAEIGKWFILRLAASKDVWSTFTDEYYGDPDIKETTTSQDLLPLALGFGYKRGNLRIDGYASPDVFYNGPYFLTGSASTLFYSISILYSFASY